MSPADRKYIMKSTLKIDYDRGQENYSVIKIVIPDKPPHPIKCGETPGFAEDIDEDVRDKLIQDLLHTPCWSQPNHFFEVKTTFPIESGRLTTIGAILEDRLFYTFRHAIINRIVPYDTIIATNIEKNKNIANKDPLNGRENYHKEHLLNKIDEFFDWLDKQEYASFEERSPK